MERTAHIRTWIYRRTDLRFTKHVHMLLILVTLVPFLTSTAFAAAVISISSGGGGVFVVQGAGFNKVAGAKVTVSYDTSTLANPRVSQGGLMSGALMATNTGVPGFVTLAMITTDPKGISGDGPIATISFDLPGSSPGVIKSLTAELASASNGARLDVQPQVFNPSGAASASSDSSTQSPSSTGQSTVTASGGTVSQSASAPSGTLTGSTVGLGNVTVGTYGEAEKEKAKDEPSVPSVPAGVKEATPTTPESKPAEAAPPTAPDTRQASTASSTSILERFRAFAGAKTPQSLMELFKQSGMQEIRQEPPIALTDGTTTVRVFVASSSGKGAPSVSLKGAKLVSMKKAGENVWAVEVLPRTGAIEVSIKILRDGSVTEIPLTVAPALPKEMTTSSGGKLTESDFNLFLKERGTDKAPRFDLNGDGKRDYVDDYILTANYLVQHDSLMKVTTKEHK